MAQILRKTPIRRPTAEPHREQQTFLEHLSELRSRLFVVAIALSIGTGLGFVFHDRIAHILLTPLAGEKLVYLTPGGGLDFIFRISFYTGLTLSVPVIIYELYAYLAPAMKCLQTRRFITLVIALACILAIIGIVFGYFCILPPALHFLLQLGGGYVQASLTASSYLDFVAMHSFAYAAIFELPILLLIINETNGPLQPRQLLKSERYVVPAAFLLAALFAPTPDMLSQLTVALPILLVYQIGIGIVLLQNRKRRANAKARQTAIFVPSRPQPAISRQTHASTPAISVSPLSFQSAPFASVKRTPVMVDIMKVRSAGSIPKAPPRRTVTPVRRQAVVDGFFTRSALLSQ